MCNLKAVFFVSDCLFWYTYSWWFQFADKPGSKAFHWGGLPYFRQCHNLLASSEVLTPIQYLPSPLSPSLTLLVSHNAANHQLTHLLHTGPNTNTSIIHYTQTPRLPLLWYLSSYYGFLVLLYIDHCQCLASYYPVRVSATHTPTHTHTEHQCRNS